MFWQFLPLIFIASTVVFILVWLAVLKFGPVQQWLLKMRMTPQQKNLEEKWQHLEKMLESDNEFVHRVAVVEADKLLDQALKSHKLAGVDVGQRLKVAGYKFDVEPAWQAHKVRNRLVHEGDFHLNKDLAQKTLTNYKKALKNLKAF